MTLFRATTALVLALGATFATPALAQKKYDTGASDTEIKVGQTIPLSGPASAYGSIGKVQAAYVRMINEQGGVNGRKINLIQYDDGYSPPKTVEQVRKLVEGDEVLTTFQIIGTPPNASVQKYLNEKKVPQLLASTGATRFTDPKNFPWTIAFNPNYQSEGAYLRTIHSCQLSKREDRHSVSKRRPWKRLRQGTEGRAWGEGFEHDRRRGILRIVGSDRRLADGDAESFRRRPFL